MGPDSIVVDNRRDTTAYEEITADAAIAAHGFTRFSSEQSATPLRPLHRSVARQAWDSHYG
jgi:hypothetical protein